MTIFFSILSLIIGGLSTFFVDRCKNISIAPEQTRKKLIHVFKIAAFATGVMGVFKFNTDKIFRLFHSIWWYIGIFSTILAVLPSVSAYIERRKDRTAAEKWYALKNLGFNFLGVACVWCMLFTLYHEVADFRFLQSIPVLSIISLTIPLCLWVVLSYQSTEQQEQENLNHDASLKRKNQLLNVLHLFCAFFCSLTAAALMIAYTLYCHLYHVEIVLDIWYLLALSILLVFFYTCGLHVLPHIRMVCMSNVPAILIASVYWMSWFTVNGRVFLYQSVFIVIHSLIYVTIVYRNMNFYKKDDTKEQMSIWRGLITTIRHPKKTLNIIRKKLEKYQFYIITLVIVVSIYIVFIFVPLFITQQSVLSFKQSKIIITAVCEGTDHDVEAIFEEMKENEWANKKTETIDCVRFADFIYHTLQPELLEKNIIEPDDQSLSYDQLKTWFGF